MPCHLKNTTWNDYIYEALLHSGYITKAGIYGLHTGEVWAASDGFEVPEDLARALAQSFADPTEINIQGIPLDGISYLPVIHNDRMIVARKLKQGCILARCTRCIIIAIFDDIANFSYCNKTVESLVNYFVSKDI